MHQHSRNSDAEDPQAHRLLAAAESTTAKVMNRLLTPVLALVLAVLGFFAVRLLNDVAANQRQQADNQVQQGLDIAQVKSDVRNLNTRLDEGIIRQVNQNTQSMQDLDRRVRVLERAVPTP